MSSYFLEWSKTAAIPLIRSFASLPEGWHYGSGRCATERAVEQAIAVSDLLLECHANSIEAFPAIDGGVLVSGYHGEETLDILCGPTGVMDLEHEVDDEIVEELHGMSLDAVKSYIGKLAWPPKKSFVLSTSGTTVGKEDVSRVSYSAYRRKMGEYRSSIQNAPSAKAKRNVSTFGRTTVLSLTIRQSSGGSTPPDYRLAANSDTPLRRLETVAI